VEARHDAQVTPSHGESDRRLDVEARSAPDARRRCRALRVRIKAETASIARIPADRSEAKDVDSHGHDEGNTMDGLPLGVVSD
jgi:hypothetical protein